MWGLGKLQTVEAAETIASMVNEALDDEFIPGEEDKVSVGVWALGEIGDKRSEPAILNTLRESLDTGSRENAITALAKINLHSYWDLFVDLLNDKDEKVRIAAIRALKEFPPEKALPVVKACLQDSSPYVRESAQRAVGELERAEIFDPIRRGRDKFKDNSQQADAILDFNAEDFPVESLMELNFEDSIDFTDNPFIISDDSDIETLLRDLSSLDGETRCRAALLLGNSKRERERVLDALVHSLKDPHSNFRWHVAKALGKLGDSRAVPYLIDTLNDEDKDVREDTVKALEDLRAVESVKHIVELLKDDYPSVRIAVIETLGTFEGPEAEKGLIEALKDPSIKIKRVAVQSLTKAGGKDSLKALEKYVDHEHPKLREESLRACEVIKDRISKSTAGE